VGSDTACIQCFLRIGDGAIGSINSYTVDEPLSDAPTQQPEDEPMASHRNEVPHKELKTSRQIFDESMKIRRQIDNGRPRKSEDDLQRELFGPRGVPGQPDPATMVPQRKKKTPTDFDPGHTA
jgi:hypothetical protein